MIKLYATILATATVLALVGLDRTRDRARRDERGSLSTEQVVVTGGLLLLAIAVAGAIKLAVDGRLDVIK
jgi:hypothetical protein